MAVRVLIVSVVMSRSRDHSSLVSHMENEPQRTISEDSEERCRHQGVT